MNDEFMKREERELASKNRDKCGRKPSADEAFDIWLDRGLRNMFGEVENEPIPADLLALIKRDRERS